MWTKCASQAESTHLTGPATLQRLGLIFKKKFINRHGLASSLLLLFLAFGAALQAALWGRRLAQKRLIQGNDGSRGHSPSRNSSGLN